MKMVASPHPQQDQISVYTLCQPGINKNQRLPALT